MTTQANQRARNLGSNYTTFRYKGQSIAYLQSVTDTGQRPVVGGEAVHPLGHRHPTEFVVARAVSAGSLTVTITEMWREEVWQQLAGLAGTNDIVDVFDRIAKTPNPITCTKIITPPIGNRYGKTYHNCVISDVQDGETFSITSLTAPKTLTIAYTHTTRL